MDGRKPIMSPELFWTNGNILNAGLPLGASVNCVVNVSCLQIRRPVTVREDDK